MSDYIVQDSSLFKYDDAYGISDNKFTGIYIGIVRKSELLSDGNTIYTVEYYLGGKQVPISCFAMTRFNSPYNFEEIRLKPWLRGPISSGLLPAGTASTYNMRDGEVVIVAPLDGNGREGVILGTVRHPSRKQVTEEGTLAYHSVYNGLETKIDPEGAYTVTFQGAPLNDATPIPPGLSEVAEAQYNPLISGSFFGFDNTGSFAIDVSNELGANMIKLTRDPAGGTILIESGKNIISIGGNPALGELSVTTDTYKVEVLESEMKATTAMKFEALQMSIKGTQVAIGNDTIELIDGLLQILDGIGQVVVTSPVGTCTPIMASPQWASTITPLIVKLNTLKGSL
jgi:hypothetical protein